MLVWSFSPSVSTWEEWGRTKRCYLLVNAKKWWETTRVEFIEPTLGKWYWRVRSCRTRPFNPPEVQIKLNCPRETSKDCLHVGPWRVLWPVRKNIFSRSTTSVWKMYPAVEVFTFYSVLSFPLLTVLEERWHIELWGPSFPQLCQKGWTVGVESALQKTGPHHTTAVHTTPRAVPTPVTPRFDAPGALLTAGCFLRQLPRYCTFHWGGRNAGSNRLIRDSWLKIKPRSLYRCSALKQDVV